MGDGIMRRHALSDVQWHRIEHFFPTNGGRGGQWKNHRLMVDGILWMLKTGAPWRDLPEPFGPWQTVYERFKIWSQKGLWDEVLKELQKEFNIEGRIDWELFCIDGSNIRAHRCAAGAQKKFDLRRTIRSRAGAKPRRIRNQDPSCLR